MSVDPQLFDHFATDYDRFVSFQPGQNDLGFALAMHCTAPGTNQTGQPRSAD